MNTTPMAEDIWGSCDYAPTAARLDGAARVVAEALADAVDPGAHVADLGAGHGHTAAALLGRGLRVTAIEPVARMADVGRERVPGVQWHAASGERTGLRDDELGGIASSFGAMFCDPVAGPREWARILVAGGTLVMTAWDDNGFLAEMTDRMMRVMDPGTAAPPPHMAWGDDTVARDRLTAGGFSDIRVEHRELPWSFDSVEEGMRLYLHGSPTHAWSLERAADRRPDLLAALREHLEEHAEPSGAIRSVAGYALITAVAR